MTERIVVVVTPEQKAAIQRIAGGPGEVSQFIRYLCHQAAILKSDPESGETLGEEFKVIVQTAVERLVGEAIARAQVPTAVRPEKRTLSKRGGSRRG